MEKYGRFHDGAFLGISTNNKKPEECIVSILLQTYAEVDETLIAAGVETLICSNFRQGNIINSVNIYQPDEIPFQRLCWAYGLDETMQDIDRGRKLLEQAREKGLSLLEITSSYGADCFVLASSFEFRP